MARVPLPYGVGGSTAKGITLNDANTANTTLPASAGSWKIGSLTLTKGTVTVGTGASLKVTGGAGSLTGAATDGVLNVSTGGALTAHYSDLLEAHFDKKAAFDINISGIVYAKGRTGDYQSYRT